MNGTRTCTIDGCIRKFYAHDLCSLHYRRVRTAGEPGTAGVMRMRGWSLREKILARIQIDPITECWVWGGSCDSSGYGSIGHEGRTISTHRAAYCEFVGLIPHGLHLDHLCRNRACCNPRHLEAVTPRENVRRGGMFRRSDICHRGHRLEGANLRITPAGKRICRACKNDLSKAYQKRRRAAAALTRAKGLMPAYNCTPDTKPSTP